MTLRDPSRPGATTAPSVIPAGSIGEAWLLVARRILDLGRAAEWAGAATIEVANVVLDVAAPSSDDPVIAEHADPERLAWMRANFTDPARVAELGDARSYFSRLHDHAAGGLDQVAGAIDRLRADPTRRDVLLSTLEPGSDTTYVPCVALIDLWIPDEALETVVSCHSIDFGTKGYANLLQLAALQEHVAAALGRPVGRLTMAVKTAHVYARDEAFVRAVLARAALARAGTGDGRTPTR